MSDWRVGFWKHSDGTLVEVLAVDDIGTAVGVMYWEGERKSRMLLGVESYESDYLGTERPKRKVKKTVEMWMRLDTQGNARKFNNNELDAWQWDDKFEPRMATVTYEVEE